MTQSSKQVTTAKRKPPNAGKGRKPGTPNKTTALLKDAILKAAEAAGQDGNGKDGLIGYCKFLAINEPKAFAPLMGKVLPLQIAGTGDPMGAVRIEMVIVDAGQK